MLDDESNKNTPNMNSPEIIYHKVSGIIEIIAAKVERYRIGTKNRGKKYCYMIYVKFKDADWDSPRSFGFRVLNKKATMRIVHQIEAANKTIYARFLREAYGHHLYKLLDSIHSYLHKHNVLGEKHFPSHYNSIGNKDYFPTFYMLCKEFKKMNLFQTSQG